MERASFHPGFFVWGLAEDLGGRRGWSGSVRRWHPLLIGTTRCAGNEPRLPAGHGEGTMGYGLGWGNKGPPGCGVVCVGDEKMRV